MNKVEGKVTIVTNGVPRDIVYGFELTEKERKEFDYLDNDEILETEFFRYKGQVYELGDFCISPIKGWDGYKGESYFSGILVKFVPNERVIVGSYYC